MSKFSMTELASGVIRGMTEQYGNAWHFNSLDPTSVWNHFPHFVPVERLKELLGWDVIPLEVAVNIGTAEQPDWRVEVEYSAWVRDDSKQLVGRSIHTDSYMGHGPKVWVCDTVEPLLGPDCGIMAAGQLGGFWWTQLCSPEKVSTPQGVSFLPNIVLASSLDGTVASHVRKSTQVNECDNTFNADLARNEATAVKIRHTKNSKSGLYEYKDAVADLSGIAEAFSEAIENLTSEHVTDEQFRSIVSFLVPLPEDGNKRGTTVADDKRLDLHKLWQNDNRVSPWRNTTFGVVQAFNTWAQHEAQVRKGVTRFARNMSNFVAGKSEANDNLVLDTVRAVLADA